MIALALCLKWIAMSWFVQDTPHRLLCLAFASLFLLIAAIIKD